MAASGSAIRVMSDPKIEIVAADQTRRNAWFRQSGDAKGFRTEAEHSAPGIARRGPSVKGGSDGPAIHSACSVRQNSRTPRDGLPPTRPTN